MIFDINVLYFRVEEKVVDKNDQFLIVALDKLKKSVKAAFETMLLIFFSF